MRESRNDAGHATGQIAWPEQEIVEKRASMRLSKQPNSSTAQDRGGFAPMQLRQDPCLP